MPSAQYVKFTFTLNNYTPEQVQAYRDLYDPEAQDPVVRYLIFQYELAPTTGTPHLQGFIHLHNKHKTTWPVGIKRILPGNPNIKRANGSPMQNKTYCSKPETRDPAHADCPYEEFGTCIAGQGSRNRQREVAQMARDGKRIRLISEEDPDIVMRHFRGLQYLRQSRTQTVRQMPKLYIFWGDSRSGKSYQCLKRAQDKYGPEEIYYHRGGKWWNDYDGHKCVIFNDFTHASITPTEFKKVVDETPHQVETKGGSVWLEFEELYISSNYPPRLWWPNADAGATEPVFERTHFCAFLGRVDPTLRSYDVPILKQHLPWEVPLEAKNWVQKLEPGFDMPITLITGEPFPIPPCAPRDE